MTNNNTKLVNFTFIYDPAWTESDLLAKFKTEIAKDDTLYRYKLYLNDLSKIKTFAKFFIKKQKLPISTNNTQPAFWILGDLIYTSYIHNKEKKNVAIIFRCYFIVDYDNKNIKIELFFDHETNKTILNEANEPYLPPCNEN